MWGQSWLKFSAWLTVPPLLAQCCRRVPRRDGAARGLRRRESIYPTTQSAGHAMPPGHPRCHRVTNSYFFLVRGYHHSNWSQLHMSDWGKGRQDWHNAVQPIRQGQGSWGRPCGRTRGMASATLALGKQYRTSYRRFRYRMEGRTVSPYV